MSTFGLALRRARRLGFALDAGTKALNSTLRRASTAATRHKVIVEGANGERIIPSPYGEVTYPEVTIPEYVWNNVESYSKKTALECGLSGKKYSYAEARDATNYIARSLRNMGFKENDVIALVAPNDPDTILAFLGILEAGLIVTTVNPYYTVGEISKQLESSNVKGVITAAEIAGTVLSATRSTLPSSTPFVVIEDASGIAAPEGSIPFKDLISRGRSLPPLPPTTSSRSGKSPHDVAVLPYSSGTTGLPKGVMLSHANLVANIEMVEGCSGDDIWRPTTETYQEVIPMILPFFHIFGMNGAVLPRLSQGCKLVTLPKFMPDSFLDVMDKSKATVLFCVPPVVLFLSASPMVKKHHIEHVHAAFSGAAPLGQADVERLYDKFGLNNETLRFCQGYGLTECSPVSFIEKTGMKYASVGKNVKGCEIRLVDPITNEDVSQAGQTGEVWIRGPHVMKGYLNNEEATRETIVEGGWLKTGDIAHFDDDHDFFITDRLKELIKVKGFQVAPAELEALLRTHPDVEEAAVIGIPDPRSGEVPRAFILPKKGKTPSEEDIANFVKGKVSEYKELQGGVQFVESIPKNPSGKILRSHLKNDYLSS